MGAVGSYICFFVAERLDTVVREEEDLSENFGDIPILGTVPPLGIEGDEKGGDRV